jgi:hypothetical protein
MFGTLVICLPSAHTGGEVHLLHGGKEVALSTAPDSFSGLSALAWYSDVQHETKPVASGYRLVLTYNLVQDGRQPMQSAAALNAAFITPAVQSAAAHVAASLSTTKSTWTREPGVWRRTHRNCYPCGSLARFMASPTQQTENFRYTNNIRIHLEKMVSPRTDFEIHTDRKKSPLTLVIRKTNNAHKRATEDWKKTVQELEAQLYKLRTSYMRDVLGGDVKDVAGFREKLGGILDAKRGAREAAKVRLRKARAMGAASASAQNIVPPAAGAGVKRKAEVVDLTDGDSP